ncbi:tetratricopeptide repeat protein [Ensifer sp. IC3342]|nr:tetratricopeptide repeat protein [Ensifer sp. BRP08]MCA1450288.1 tetratricopeptide repeat protein [Ensifer sp. IC3342]
MIIDVIGYAREFEKIRENWNRVYLSDPESHPLLSWNWLNEYFSCRERWFILAFRQEQTDNRYDAFLPLEVTTLQDDDTGLFSDQLLMIGNRDSGESGFLCMPGLENEAADAFAIFLMSESWTSMRFELCETSSARLEHLLQAFPGGPLARSSEYRARGETDEDPVHSVLIRTRTGRNLHDRLNRRSVGFVFERAMALHIEGEFDAAEAGYRQVIRTIPGHVQARYALAQLCSERGDHAEAEYLYRWLLSALPDADEILHRLGDTQMEQGSYGEASKTFEKLVGRHPHRGMLRYKLAVTLLAAGRRGAAIAAFLSFDEVASDDSDHIRCKLKAREVLRRLEPVCGMEQQPEVQQQPISFESTGPLFGYSDPVPVPSARVQRLAPWLLEPSLPSGAWAHLHARSCERDCKGSRLKH